MANSPIVTSLPAYVEERRLPLIAKAVLGAKSAQMFNLQTDVKEKSALNILTTDVAFGDGKACGWSETGSSTLSQRYIEPQYFKVNQAFCEKKLLGTWAGYAVKVAAGSKTLPFEEMFISDIVAHVNEKVEKILWQGNKSNSSGSIECDGILKILTDAESTVDVSFASGSNAYDKVKAMYNAIPAEIIDKEDTAIFVGEDDYRDFIQNLVDAKLYHVTPEYNNGEYMLPGTTIKVIAVNGLNGTHKMVAGQKSNIYYGCDMANDKEVFDFWYSKDNREFRLAIEFVAGVQVAFPDQMVLGQPAA